MSREGEGGDNTELVITRRFTLFLHGARHYAEGCGRATAPTKLVSGGAGAQLVLVRPVVRHVPGIAVFVGQ